MLFNINCQTIIYTILNDWLSLEELSNLDNSCTNINFREELFKIYKLIRIKFEVNKYSKLYNFVVKRKFKFDILPSVKELIIEYSNKLHLQFNITVPKILNCFTKNIIITNNDGYMRFTENNNKIEFQSDLYYWGGLYDCTILKHLITRKMIYFYLLNIKIPKIINYLKCTPYSEKQKPLSCEKKYTHQYYIKFSKKTIFSVVNPNFSEEVNIEKIEKYNFAVSQLFRRMGKVKTIENMLDLENRLNFYYL